MGSRRVSQSHSSDVEPRAGLANSGAANPNLTYDDAAEEIVALVQPRDAQFEYRASVLDLLKKQVRLALSANAIEIGIHELRCFLPADPIKLSVVLNRNNCANWHTALFERLNILSERGSTNLQSSVPAAVPSAADGESQEIPDKVELNGEGVPLAVPSADVKPPAPSPHRVSSVDFTTDGSAYRITCMVDSLEVEVSANSRSDACMLAFIEEVSMLVGQDFLFKKALLLIRAWWCYETAAYVGSSIKHYLSDAALCIMVCSIFNQYHTRIGTPFQALCCFLTEYENYDGATQAVTLQGVVPFISPTSNQPSLLFHNEGHLISSQMLDKYRQLFSIADGAGADSAVAPAHAQRYPYLAADPAAMAKMARKPAHLLASFARYGYNVVHPFLFSNMITEKLSTRRTALISKVFHTGKSTLSSALQQPGVSTFEVVRAFFPTVYARFGNQWRPDVFGNNLKDAKAISPQEDGRSLMHVSLDRIWRNIFYCNFIIESVLSESALLTVSIEVLTEKGPLPAGEVGKMLTALSGIPNLSLKLKEKFGGLKKFLERFPDVFIFSTEHPFNPHVLLRSSLTPEQLDSMERGVFPAELLHKQKKVSAGVVASKPRSTDSTDGKSEDDLLEGVMDDLSLSHLNASPVFPQPSTGTYFGLFGEGSLYAGASTPPPPGIAAPSSDPSLMSGLGGLAVQNAASKLSAPQKAISSRGSMSPSLLQSGSVDSSESDLSMMQGAGMPLAHQGSQPGQATSLLRRSFESSVSAETSFAYSPGSSSVQFRDPYVSTMNAGIANTGATFTPGIGLVKPSQLNQHRMAVPPPQQPQPRYQQQPSYHDPNQCGSFRNSSPQYLQPQLLQQQQQQIYRGRSTPQQQPSPTYGSSSDSSPRDVPFAFGGPMGGPPQREPAYQGSPAYPGSARDAYQTLGPGQQFPSSVRDPAYRGAGPPGAGGGHSFPY